MQNLTAALSNRKTASLLAISMPLVFGLLAVIRLYPFTNHLPDVLKDYDDWRFYAQCALDIKHHGILMPSISGPFFAPSAFLYSYFLAFCFTVFGENTVPVYILQSVLTGAAITLIYFSFLDKIKTNSLLFLFTLFLFGLVDVFKNYSFYFLSENLALFTMAVFFYCFMKGVKRSNQTLLICAAAFLGISSLIRPNIFLFVIAGVVVLFFYFMKGKGRLAKFVLPLLILAITSSLLAVRNYLVCKQWIFIPTTGIEFAGNYFNEGNFSLSLYFKNALCTIGFMNLNNLIYQWRPHWTIMWIGFFVYLYMEMGEKRRKKSKWQIWEVALLLYIITYFGSLILIPNIGYYGFRFFIPGVFFVLPFFFVSIDRLNEKLNQVSN